LTRAGENQIILPTNKKGIKSRYQQRWIDQYAYNPIPGFISFRGSGIINYLKVNSPSMVNIKSQ